MVFVITDLINNYWMRLSTIAGPDLGEGPSLLFGIFFLTEWLLNWAENALLLPFVHKDVIALDYGAIVDDYAKRNQRRITLINLLQ